MAADVRITVTERAGRQTASTGAKWEPIMGYSRTRMFVTDVSRWEEVASVHGELFGEIRPCTTLVEVARLIDDAALIEIEADAVVP